MHCDNVLIASSMRSSPYYWYHERPLAVCLFLVCIVISSCSGVGGSSDDTVEDHKVVLKHSGDGRGVAPLQGVGSHVIEEIKSFLDRNEPFVWRNCLDMEQIIWWDNDSNLIQEEGDAMIRVRVVERRNNSSSASTTFQRFGDSQSYHHANTTLRDYLLQMEQDTLSSFHRYAAQIDLVETLPRLVPHLPAISDEILDVIGPSEQQTIYIGRGTKTQLHYDSRENFVCVLSGSKSFKLYDPLTSAALLYIDSNQHGNTSPIEDGEYSMAKYALPVKVQIHAGDCMYLPIYWFHSVEAATWDSRSISVNWWRRPDPTKKDIVGRLLCGQTHRQASAKC